jgi:hypothetical protein
LKSFRGKAEDSQVCGIINIRREDDEQLCAHRFKAHSGGSTYGGKEGDARSWNEMVTNHAELLATKMAEKVRADQKS